MKEKSKKNRPKEGKDVEDKPLNTAEGQVVREVMVDFARAVSDPEYRKKLIDEANKDD